MVGHGEKLVFGLFLVSRRVILAFACVGSVEGPSLPLFRMHSVARFVQNAFAYRVVVKFVYRVVKFTTR